MNFIGIAWRNLWRNKRRTIITAASVFFAIWFALILRAFQLGSYDLMESNIVHVYSGYFQVHARGYWADPVLNNAFTFSPSLDQSLRSQYGISGYAPRIESFSLASFGMRTKGVAVNGISPEAENNLTSLRKKLVAGEYLGADDSGALLCQRLASHLRIGVGDSLVLIGQGYHGATAAGIFVVKGIVHLPSPELDGRFVFLTLHVARKFFGAETKLTSIAFNVRDPGTYKTTADQLRRRIDPDTYEVMTWEQMMPDVVQQIKADNGSGLIILGILYMIVGFGIFGTLLMMLSERAKEFGMLIAIGMQRGRLVLILIAETLFLGLLGIVAGIAAALPVIFYFHSNPIKLTGAMAESMVRMGFEPLMPTAWKTSFFISQSLVILGIIMVLVGLPIARIWKLKIMNAIRH